MFIISKHPLDAARLQAGMVNRAAGAYAEFQGWVRDHNEGRSVAALEYEAFAELAAHEGHAILDEARRQFDLLEARCVHRVGHLQIGELAVWVGVTARHRDAAFRACRMIIDAVKLRVPIWKKEHYADGQTAWVSCAACAQHAHEPDADRRPPPPPSEASMLDVGRWTLNVSDPSSEAGFYRRQMLLPQVGAEGQRRLKAARVLVVGAGGLGCPALQYLAAAGIGNLTVCDNDVIEIANLHRQILFDVADVGRNKAEVAAEKLRRQNPFITVTPLRDRCERAQARKRLRGYDAVLDCTDNFSAKFMLHDACFLESVPLVQASIYQFEGQFQLFRPGSGAGCLRCLWPDAPPDDCVGACADVGVLGAVTGVLGALQAVETLKLLLDLPDLCDRHTLLLDLFSLDLRRVARERNPRCPLCGAVPQPPASAAPPRVSPDGAWLVDARDLTTAALADLRVIDIRSVDERAANPAWVQRLLHIDWTDLARFAQLDPALNYLLACAHGVRSRQTVSRLREAGHANFYSLRQGIDALEPFLVR